MIGDLNRFFYERQFEKIKADAYLSDGARIFYDSPYNFSRLTGFSFDCLSIDDSKKILSEVKELKEKEIKEQKGKKKGNRKK